MTIPCIHLNGTAKHVLIEQYFSVLSNLNGTRDMLAEASPNARDYYPLGDDAYRSARKEHEARLQKLDSVIAELNVLIEKIDEA